MKMHLSAEEYEFYTKHVFKDANVDPLSASIELTDEVAEAMKGRINKVILEIQNKIEARQQKNIKAGFSHSRLPDSHVYRSDLEKAKTILRKLLALKA